MNIIIIINIMKKTAVYLLKINKIYPQNFIYNTQKKKNLKMKKTSSKNKDSIYIKENKIEGHGNPTPTKQLKDNINFEENIIVCEYDIKKGKDDEDNYLNQIIRKFF